MALWRGKAGYQQWTISKINPYWDDSKMGNFDPGLREDEEGEGVNHFWVWMILFAQCSANGGCQDDYLDAP